MAREYKTDTILTFSWEQVVAGFWLRYPNPHSRHVLTEDIIDRYLDSEGRLHTRRLFKKTNSMPKWVSSIVPKSPKDMWIVEDSICDSNNKRFVVKTVNAGYSNIMKITETATFTPCTPVSSTWTRHAHAVSRIYGAATALQMFAIERYKRNAGNAMKGYKLILNHLYGGSGNLQNSSEFSRKLAKLEKLRRKAGEMAVDKGEELVHSGLGAAGVQFKK